ncbi:sel1 repeat family protein [Planktomarina temperata]|nr:sel1 repeat family protein [Planktomarina temperata]MDB4101031.1 sel1 repeat family protein [Planktomarina temperata]MDC0931085.1 tetratricopeptide repeat protein [Planktomarina temperata]
MIRIICSLALLVMIVVTTARAQTETIEANPDIFVNAINAIEKKDFQTAVELFTILAREGEPTSQHNLSILYFKGLGSPVSYKRALYWAWRASLGGSEPAMAVVDDVRDMVTEDLIGVVSEEIVSELTAKAMDGDTNAAERLGKTYYKLFVEPDLKMAYTWSLISQAFGNERVSDMIAEIEDLIPIEDRITYQEEATEIFIKIPK